MHNIKNFKTEKEIERYIDNLKIKYIGSGTEGYVSLTRDNDTVKYIIERHRVPYNREIITSNDFNLESFMFPTELILNQDYVAGYRAPYFKGDIFNSEIKEIDLHDLLEARERIIKDVKVLSKEKYIMSDLKYNLLFNGKKFMAIDTLDYKRVKNLKLYDNLYLLDNSIKYILNIIEPRTVLSSYLPVEKMVKKIIKEQGSSKITSYKSAI